MEKLLWKQLMVALRVHLLTWTTEYTFTGNRPYLLEFRLFSKIFTVVIDLTAYFFSRMFSLTLITSIQSCL